MLGFNYFNSNFNFKGSTYDQTLEAQNRENEIVGSYLNHNIIQDGSLYTDYSYIVNAGGDGVGITYHDLFKRIIHPAGLNAFLELDIDNYENIIINLSEDDILYERYVDYKEKYHDIIVNRKGISEDAFMTTIDILYETKPNINYKVTKNGLELTNISKNENNINIQSFT